MLAVSLCALCGQTLTTTVGLCLGHDGGSEDGWAAVNRVMCDFFHRGLAPARLRAADRCLEEPEHEADVA